MVKRDIKKMEKDPISPRERLENNSDKAERKEPLFFPQFTEAFIQKYHRVLERLAAEETKPDA